MPPDHDRYASDVDLYARLGVTAHASPPEIDAAYRRRARLLHPDTAREPGGQPAELQLVIEAYRVLSHPDRRRWYDAQRGGPEPEPVNEIRRCPVCQGAGGIAQPCAHCSGTGQLLADGPFLRAAMRCVMCRGARHRMIRCGACNGSGRTT